MAADAGMMTPAPAAEEREAAAEDGDRGERTRLGHLRGVDRGSTRRPIDRDVGGVADEVVQPGGVDLLAVQQIAAAKDVGEVAAGAGEIDAEIVGGPVRVEHRRAAEG